MADVFSPQERSRIMARIRSRGNKTTELRLIRLLRRYKVKGWRRGSSLFGRPDFVFYKAKVALFVDGDFWHGNPRNFRLPTSNRKYWRQKIQSNRRRDRLVTKYLAESGWRVLRIWESALRDEEAIVAKIQFITDIGFPSAKTPSRHGQRAA